MYMYVANKVQNIDQTVAKKKMLSILLVIAFSCSVVTSQDADGGYCLPQNVTCWPSRDAVKVFEESLDGIIVRPGDSLYHNATLLMNTRYTQRPALVVGPHSESDVQKAVIFARRYRIRISIYGTGHDFIGRSTSNGSLMIHTFFMKKFEVVNATAFNKYKGPAVTVGAGNNWGTVYNKLDKTGYVIVGGSSPTVGMGGYTIGGGHSPMSRMFGLGVDNVLEISLVLADGRLARATESGTKLYDVAGGLISTEASSDLFWAVRGGGAAYGVVTRIIFKVHKSPTVFVRYVCAYPWRSVKHGFIGDSILQNFFTQIRNLPRQWGGYAIFNGINNAPFGGPKDQIGIILFSMLYSGDSYRQAAETIKQIYNFKRDKAVFCYPLINYTSFWDYEKTIHDTHYGDAYITNILLTNGSFTGSNLTETLSRHMMPGGNNSGGSGLTCTGVLIGGHVEDYPDSSASVSSDLRHAQLSLTCGVGWDEKSEYLKKLLILSVQTLQSDLRSQFGRGVYYNEPPYYLDDWKTANWGDNYDRLLAIKKEYDPYMYWRCWHCVGSDIGVVRPNNHCVYSRCNHGRCESTYDSYRCVCKEGWTGTQCDVSTKCTCAVELKAIQSVVDARLNGLVLQLLEQERRIEKMAFGCPAGSVGFGKSCYTLETRRLGWADAQKYCRAKFGNLLTIETAEENAFVKGIISKNLGKSTPWVGGYWNAKKWQWSAKQGSDLTFTDWPTTKQPDSGCLRLVSTEAGKVTWDSAGCYNRSTSICEVDL